MHIWETCTLLDSIKKGKKYRDWEEKEFVSEWEDEGDFKAERLSCIFRRVDLDIQRGRRGGWKRQEQKMTWTEATVFWGNHRWFSVVWLVSGWPIHLVSCSTSDWYILSSMLRKILGKCRAQWEGVLTLTSNICCGSVGRGGLVTNLF